MLAERPDELLSELRAEFPADEDELEQVECPPDRPLPHGQLPLDRHLKELMGDDHDPDSPIFISPFRRPAKPARD